MPYFYEKSTSRVAKRLARFPYYGTDKVLNLLEYQDDQQQFIISDQHLETYFISRRNELTTSEKLALYFSLFKGRLDVYAKSYINDQGKIQYYPSYNYGWRNLPAEKRTCQPLTDQVLKEHLQGKTSIGIFPMTKDDTCSFLAIDFDKKDWQEAVSVFREIAEQHSFQAHVEISRSGNGAHVWFFFEEEISCQQARNFGKSLLELSMQASKSVSFSSFDRMFPNQDILPKGGFGNLIALPLQGEAFSKGRTVFVDKDFKLYADQWEYLQGVERINQEKITKFLGQKFLSQQNDKCLEISLSNVLSIRKDEISAKTYHFLRKLASFSNPEFYLKQATRQPTYQTPERIYLFEETEEDLMLPRGLLSSLKEHFEEIKIKDNRYSHDSINVTFNGQLRFEQDAALGDLLASENGVLSAETGFGKTVLGAALIASRQKKALILVHNRQLLEQWLERLSQFLTFEEDEAVRYTPSGREKVIGHIGQYGASKKWRSKLVDVVMIQSLFKGDNISIFLDDYDMMIIDECHHVTALQFEKVVAQFSGKYLYGLTATPERKNGHEPILFQRIGDILHTAKTEQSEFEKHLNLRLTSFGKLDLEKSKSTSFVALSDWLAKDEFRNQMIVQDILQMYADKHKILVLVNRVEHLEILQNSLTQESLDNIFCLSGKSKRKESKETLEQIEGLGNEEPLVLLSTGKYVGEGFDLPKLDTLILAAPLSWKNNLIQYAGRLHRPYQGKNKVEIFDYLDIHVPYLEKMYQKRQVAYQKMSYLMSSDGKKQSLFTNADYNQVFTKDMQEARATVSIQTNSITSSRIYEILGLLGDKRLSIQIPRAHKLSSWLKNLENERIRVNLLPNKVNTNVIIIDKSIVWYGNLSPFGYSTDDNMTLLRIEGSDIADEFIEKIDKR